MGAYKHDEVVIIKMGAYIHGVLILCGCLLSRFYGMKQNLQLPTSIKKIVLLCYYRNKGEVENM